MSEQAKFEKVALVDNAANSLSAALNSLRISYIIDNENESFTSIRANIYYKAMLYKDGVAPFFKVTTRNIGIVCNKILNSKFYEIKVDLDKLINDAKSNVQLCDYTTAFHLEILTEFKKIQGEFIRTILRLTSDIHFKLKIYELMLSKDFKLTDIKPIITSYDDGKSDNKQILDFSEIVMPILEPLLESISNYYIFLTQISGSFSALLVELGKLKELIEQANMGEEGLELIKFYAKNINESCTKYQKTTSDYESDLDSIHEDKPSNSCISTWIPEVINKNKKGSCGNLKKLLTEKKERRLIYICGLQNYS